MPTRKLTIKAGKKRLLRFSQELDEYLVKAANREGFPLVQYISRLLAKVTVTANPRLIWDVSRQVTR